ncbi:MAG: cation:proton antiporter [Spirochaetales bacterium]|nr:cation:proton antiporter [Spirochaetales bacterium]
MLQAVQGFVGTLPLPLLLVVGLITLAGFYLGRAMRFVRLPSVIGFMLVGVLLGPSVLNLISETLKGSLDFITNIALGFVAISIGLELSLSSLRRQGLGIILIIIAESFLAFAAVTAAIYLLTRNLPLALIFGSLAPASAPAGTVAVIQEYRARGSLTNALYAVVGFDDGLAVVIFGFAFAVARSILLHEHGAAPEALWRLIVLPLLEIGSSFLIGGLIAAGYRLLVRPLAERRDIFILTFAAVLLTVGICELLHLSLILTNLVVGIVVVNTQAPALTEKIKEELTEVMPLLFVLFFILAGANLRLSLLPALGLVGVVYIVSRSAGKMGGAWIAAVAGRADPHIRRYLGLGILSQAGVAIGLALVVKQTLTTLEPWGARIGALVITTITATSIVFEIVGPILCKLGLQRAGEIGGQSLKQRES